MATTQDVFRRAPESAAAMRRRQRTDRKGETGQKDTEMLTHESSIIVDQIITDKSRYVYVCMSVVLYTVIQFCGDGNYP